MAYQVLAEIGTVQFIAGISLPTKIMEIVSAMLRSLLLYWRNSSRCFSHTLINHSIANCKPQRQIGVLEWWSIAIMTSHHSNTPLLQFPIPEQLTTVIYVC